HGDRIGEEGYRGIGVFSWISPFSFSPTPLCSTVLSLRRICSVIWDNGLRFMQLDREGAAYDALCRYLEGQGFRIVPLKSSVYCALRQD
ncbi:MAG: hypothetical protein PHZ00_06060, partial [Candidatus Peribacteraceae bacterium]|nr:hypothetical protein [Candidatus Peribacteraceae bacterium]